jgi:hypothetical protein
MIMFDRIGSKLKSLAEVLCALGIAASVIWGVFLFDAGNVRGFVHEHTILLSLCVAVGGSIASWIVTLFIYGFGQLIENTDPTAHLYTQDLRKTKSENTGVLECKTGEKTEQKATVAVATEPVETNEASAE